jgi:predicted metalloprotease with PDZ domain
VSYYNKGEILGVLLDLKIREDSHDRYSLQDLFHSLNRDYAKPGQFFPDSDGVRGEAEKLTGSNLNGFFADYVAGTSELPYEQLFASVGLTLEKQSRTVADPGFSAARNFTPPLVVENIYGAQAQSAGLQQGDQIIAVDGKSPGRNLERQLEGMKPGTKVRLTIQNRTGRKDIELTLGETAVTAYVLHDVAQPSSAQLARRKAWLNSEDEVPNR